ncbi:MAG TPA: decarboxylating 6-phosphogluconate dehydrogenase [bacterium]|nr:decarboxylating 6-phosphogluconate dehydrogenase [bacterium]
MKLGFVGFGRMGGNMVTRLLQRGHTISVFARRPEVRAEVKAKGATPAASIAELVGQLQPPRIVWMMVPAGDATEQTIAEVTPLLAPGDIVIDGGNSNYRDSIRRAAAAKAKGIHYIDVGTSGGIWGLQVGYCLMVGGDPEPVKMVEPVFRDLAPEDGYLHAGPNGAGHYVKMIHNGIEYGMLQAYAEGFAILHQAPFRLDLKAISTLWNHGSVVRSWLLELAERAFADDPNMETIRGYVEDSGEGRWTVQEAIDRNVPAPVITLSLLQRLRSREEEDFGDKVIAALRKQFGGHAVKPKK